MIVEGLLDRFQDMLLLTENLNAPIIYDHRIVSLTDFDTSIKYQLHRICSFLAGVLIILQYVSILPPPQRKKEKKKHMEFFSSSHYRLS
jgi:hypothetical protein